MEGYRLGLHGTAIFERGHIAPFNDDMAVTSGRLVKAAHAPMMGGLRGCARGRRDDATIRDGKCARKDNRLTASDPLWTSVPPRF